jgi:glycosyltransferase involved in cell wall biosynthesis
MIDNISVVIIAKDAQETIQETLESLVSFPEVILYLNDSIDSTESIAKTFENVKVIQGEFCGFGDTKNQAASHASSDWVFSLDSDEVIEAKLLDELQTLTLENPNALYLIKRDNYFLNKKIRYSGWGNDYLARLYHKEHHVFNSNIVHEFIEPTKDTHTIRLTNPFKHNAVTNINQFLQKVIKYSDLAAKDKKTCSFLLVIAKAKFAFFKTYILQLGFLDGWRGFVIAISNFNGKFFRYTKRYIHCKEK